MTRHNSGTDSARRGSSTLICFSHLRWNFVYQRPQHLMSRLAEHYNVIFWEEAEIVPGEPSINIRKCQTTGVSIATPSIPPGLDEMQTNAILKSLLSTQVDPKAPVAVRWYYTPMMLPFSRHLATGCTVYDCMDELANFRFAPPALRQLEDELFAAADLVFTGGYSLYEAKRARHPEVHAFPSSVDVAHFAQARRISAGASASSARLGFYGVIDERMDLDLLGAIADARPEWSIEIVGPIVKIDPADLPLRDNLHYPGPSSYGELPARLSDWDVALMPFAMNESTRFISPTKTPEYLAGGRPVVSVPIVDVARHYGELEGVKIAAGAEAFVAACDGGRASRRSLISSTSSSACQKKR